MSHSESKFTERVYISYVHLTVKVQMMSVCQKGPSWGMGDSLVGHYGVRSPESGLKVPKIRRREIGPRFGNEWLLTIQYEKYNYENKSITPEIRILIEYKCVIRY